MYQNSVTGEFQSIPEGDLSKLLGGGMVPHNSTTSFYQTGIYWFITNIFSPIYIYIYIVLPLLGLFSGVIVTNLP